MLKISTRGQEMPPSPIRKLVPYAEAAKKKGIKVYHLNIGQPDIETPPAIMDAVKNADIKVLEYSHSAGNESYRRKLVEYYKSVGIEVTHDLGRCGERHRRCDHFVASLQSRGFERQMSDA